MCGRFSLTTPVDALNALFDTAERRNIAPRYNIAPMQPVEIVRRSHAGHREFAVVQWGLIPHWAKDPTMAHKMINARSETINDKPAFRGSFRHRRCLIPADGFYEWARAREKQPFRFRHVSGDVLAFAGIWENWLGQDGSEVETCAIITTAANGDVADIHDRMPVILEQEQFAAWLDIEARPKELQPLLQPFDEGRLIKYPVSRDVGSVANDGPHLHQEVPIKGYQPSFF